MIDRDLATLYKVPVKRLNEQVKRNITRFPASFRFQLSNAEKTELVANCDRLNKLKHSVSNPYAFTEQGIAMLSAVLRSRTAVQVSIQIMETFVEMRKFLVTYASLFTRINNIEKTFFENKNETDNKFKKVFAALEKPDNKPKQGIFFEGQIFDAYKFLSDLFRSARKSILIIDNYIDDSILTLLTKKKNSVKVHIYTHKITEHLKLDVQKFNLQYKNLDLI